MTDNGLAQPAPGVVVVMGVSGSGKTTVARNLADALGWHFEEGDDLHPAANVAKMHAGTPLADEDRWPWLRAIAAVIDDWRARGVHGVLTCSALKRAYRDIIIGRRGDVALIYLRGAPGLLASRMQGRQGHFMPSSLLASQLATLEEPGADELPIVVSIDDTPEGIVGKIVGELAKRGATGLPAAG